MDMAKAEEHANFHKGLSRLALPGLCRGFVHSKFSQLSWRDLGMRLCPDYILVPDDSDSLSLAAYVLQRVKERRWGML